MRASRSARASRCRESAAAAQIGDDQVDRDQPSRPGRGVVVHPVQELPGTLVPRRPGGVAGGVVPELVTEGCAQLRNCQGRQKGQPEMKLTASGLFEDGRVGLTGDDDPRRAEVPMAVARPSTSAHRAECSARVSSMPGGSYGCRQVRRMSRAAKTTAATSGRATILTATPTPGAKSDRTANASTPTTAPSTSTGNRYSTNRARAARHLNTRSPHDDNRTTTYREASGSG